MRCGAWCYGGVILSIALAVIGQSPDPSSATTPAPAVDPNRVTPGFLGFVSFVALIIAAVIIYFSLRKQLGRVDFDEDSTERDAGPFAKSAQAQAGNDIGSGGTDGAGSSASE